MKPLNLHSDAPRVDPNNSIIIEDDSTLLGSFMSKAVSIVKYMMGSTPNRSPQTYSPDESEFSDTIISGMIFSEEDKDGRRERAPLESDTTPLRDYQDFSEEGNRVLEKLNVNVCVSEYSDLICPPPPQSNFVLPPPTDYSDAGDFQNIDIFLPPPQMFSDSLDREAGDKELISIGTSLVNGLGSALTALGTKVINYVMFIEGQISRGLQTT